MEIVCTRKSRVFQWYYCEITRFLDSNSVFKNLPDDTHFKHYLYKASSHENDRVVIRVPGYTVGAIIFDTVSMEILSFDIREDLIGKDYPQDIYEKLKKFLHCTFVVKGE